jgi:hydroxymethylpyrimidine/phosphomethylpyrimidine kinase
MAETWREGGADMLAADVAELTAMGCALVLVTGTGGAGKGQGATIANTLYDDSGALETYSWPHLAGPFVGAGSTMSAALAALMAQGLAPREAVRAAQEYTNGALAGAQRFGMGKLVPNKFFRAAPFRAA